MTLKMCTLRGLVSERRGEGGPLEGRQGMARAGSEGQSQHRVVGAPGSGEWAMDSERWE